jgi:hypothetical protein
MTALATLAVHSAAATGDAEAQVVRDRAVKWLAETKTDADPQALAMRLVLWKRLGRPAEEWRPLVRRIKARQHADGGRSQTREMASDAWATGQALYALAHAGVKPGAPLTRIARAFMIKTQRDDGSWPMTSPPIASKGKGPKSLEPVMHSGRSNGYTSCLHDPASERTVAQQACLSALWQAQERNTGASKALFSHKRPKLCS